MALSNGHGELSCVRPSSSLRRLMRAPNSSRSGFWFRLMTTRVHFEEAFGSRDDASYSPIGRTLWKAGETVREEAPREPWFLVVEFRLAQLRSECTGLIVQFRCDSRIIQDRI